MKTLTKTLIISALSSVIALTGCSSDSPPTSNPPTTELPKSLHTTLQNTKWRLKEAYNSQNQTISTLTSIKDQVNVSFWKYNNNEESLSYSVGCNGYNGEYQLTADGKLTSVAIGTEKFCADTDSAERLLVGLMSSGTKLEYNSETSTLKQTSTNGTVLVWEKIPPSSQLKAKLKNTKWQLKEAYNSQNQAISTLTSIKDKVNVGFSKYNNNEESLSYSVGCNGYNGEYQLTDDGKLTSVAIGTEMFCADKDSAERLLVGLMSSGTQLEYHSETNTLKQTSTDGTVLVWQRLLTANVNATKTIGGVAGIETLAEESRKFTDIPLPNTQAEFCDKASQFAFLDPQSSALQTQAACSYANKVGKVTYTASTTSYDYEVYFY